jgi:nicotinate-nucleotide adenylyltransferase
MLALALAGEKKFVPSLIEAPDPQQPERPSYTIDTVRTLKRQLRKSDKLYVLLGIDAFMLIGKWRESEALLRECEFIVASRPGFSLADVARALPESMRPQAMVSQLFRKQRLSGDLAIGGTMIHLLDEVKEPVSATRVRTSALKGANLVRMVGETVAEYIRKQELYRPRSAAVQSEPADADAKPKLEIVGGSAHRKQEPTRHAKK